MNNVVDNQYVYDPSALQVITSFISHALYNGIPLVCDYDKFPFYRKQGLELIENS